MVCERDPDSPYDPRAGTDQRRPRRRLGRRRRDDARRGQRDRRRGCAGCRRGHGSRARPARAALHRVRGAGSRRGEEPRPVARLGTAPPQSGRDERQGDHHRLRRQLAHVHAPPARPRAGPGGSRRAGGRRVGRARRSLGRRHRPRTCQRDQGARSRALSARVPRGTVPPRAPRRRRESQRASPRSARGDRALARRGRAFRERRGARARARFASSTPAPTMRCRSAVDRLESSRRGRRVHDLPRARPARDDSRAGSSP